MTFSQLPQGTCLADNSQKLILAADSEGEKLSWMRALQEVSVQRAVRKLGWLEIQTKEGRRWKPRWIVLGSGSISLYEDSAEGSELLGVTALDISSETMFLEVPSRFAFLLLAGSNPLRCAAKTELLRNEWCEAINEEIDRKKKSEPKGRGRARGFTLPNSDPVALDMDGEINLPPANPTLLSRPLNSQLPVGISVAPKASSIQPELSLNFDNGSGIFAARDIDDKFCDSAEDEASKDEQAANPEELVCCREKIELDFHQVLFFEEKNTKVFSLEFGSF